MTVTRREFLRQSSLGVVAVATASPGSVVLPAPSVAQADPAISQICMLALDAATGAGASYADVRVMDRREQSIRTREDRVASISDDETFGIGVRVLVGGAWGFVASGSVTRRDAMAIARRAVEQARANQPASGRSVSLAPVDAYPNGAWSTPIQVDPFSVAIEDKIGLLLEANAEALRVDGARYASSTMRFVRTETTFASTVGSLIVQTAYRTQPSLSVTAVASDRSDFQIRSSSEVAPMGAGYEWVQRAALVDRAPGWAEEAVRALRAKSVEAGAYDLVLDPSNLFLTIHESVGHATELDRALGYEANYAGTSFLSPPEQVLNAFRFGPEFMNVQGDRTQPGALATVGWDDEGVPADSWPIVKDGVFVDYQTTREQAGWIAEHTGITHSHGCSHAESWNQVQFQRMPNVSLLPGEDDLVLDDLIAATDRGILVLGRGSYSIDQQRYNFQFGGQAFHEIRGGKVVGQLRDVAYQARTPEFWNSLDLLGGPRSYELGGTFNDGKGQPAQSNAVSHGCPPARFRQVSVINTARA